MGINCSNNNLNFFYKCEDSGWNEDRRIFVRSTARGLACARAGHVRPDGDDRLSL